MQQTEFARRRRQLMRSMGENSIAILPAAPERVRNRDVYYPYRQDSDFLYLTGFNEPNAVAVLIPGRPQGEYILLCQEKQTEKEIWHGPLAGQEGAVNHYRADDSFPIDDIDDILPGLMENRERVFYTMGREIDFDQKVISWLNRIRSAARSGTHAPTEFISLEHLLHEYRLYKSRAEVSAMRKAATISAHAHKRAMQMCRPGMMEYAIEAELLYEFNKHGVAAAYPCIVGSGANTCILHYIKNDQRLVEGDLLLIDAGAEYNGYAADITRTFPVSGEFTPAQRDVYEVVLEAQLSAIGKAKPGHHWNEPHVAAVAVLTKGLKTLGLLKGALHKLIKDKAYNRFYMHRTGHWLGLDVHDVGDYKVDQAWRLLEPGMVLTIEPGLYISAARDVPKCFHNIGIRIEDDVHITRDGCDVLSQDAPKTVTEIEALVGRGG